MAQDPIGPNRPRFWIVLVGLVIVLIFLYFYAPFESYVSDSITEIRARNVIFWFAALVGAVGYAIAHFASFAAPSCGVRARSTLKAWFSTRCRSPS